MGATHQIRFSRFLDIDAFHQSILIKVTQLIYCCPWKCRHIQDQRLVSEKLPKMFRRIICEKRKGFLHKTRLLLALCQWPSMVCWHNGGRCIKADWEKKRKKSRITALIGNFSEWRTRKRGDEGQKREVGKKWINWRNLLALVYVCHPVNSGYGLFTFLWNNISQFWQI